MAKSSSAKKVTKRAQARKKSVAARKNPPLTTDLVAVVAPAVASYAATRIVGRISYKMARKRSSGAAKHAGALTPAAMAAALWFWAHRSERFAEYHDGILAGSFIAALQSLVQNYLPRYGWILNDYHMDDVLPSAPKVAAPSATSLAGSSAPPLASGEIDDELMVDLSALDSAPIPGLDDDQLTAGVFSGGLN